MSDRDDPPGHGRGTTGANPQTSVPPQQDEARTGEARAVRHLRLVEKTPPAPPAAGAENTPSTRRSHLARLVDALHASRRIQAARVARGYLHLVQ
jgi:hypothetical protein